MARVTLRQASVWAAPVGLGIGLEVVALRRPEFGIPTLSDVLRAIYRTHTTAGKVAFGLSCAGGVALLFPHICNAAADVVAVVEEVIQ